MASGDCQESLWAFSADERIRRCPKCNEVKSFTDFRTVKWGECKACTSAVERDRYNNDPKRKEGLIRANKRWREKNPDQFNASVRNAKLIRQFGITAEQYDEMLASQSGGCAICRKTCSSGRRLAVDHDHATGKVRGLLCAKCNQGLGQFRDDPELLRVAMAYLETHREVP